MPIPIVVDDIETVEESVRPLYVEKEGKWTLDVEGATPREAALQSALDSARGEVKSFRDNNIILTQDQQRLQEQLEPLKGVDPEEYQRLKAQAAQLGDKGITKPDDVDERVKAAIAAAVEPLKGELAASQAARELADAKAAQALLETSAQAALTKVGVKPETVRFAIIDALKEFTIDGDTVKPKSPDAFSVDNPGQALTLDEWARKHRTDNPSLYATSAGGQARNDLPGGRPVPAGVRVITNPTPQQLGQYAQDVKKGTVIFRTTE